MYDILCCLSNIVLHNLFSVQNYNTFYVISAMLLNIVCCQCNIYIYIIFSIYCNIGFDYCAQGVANYNM